MDTHSISADAVDDLIEAVAEHETSETAKAPATDETATEEAISSSLSLRRARGGGVMKVIAISGSPSHGRNSDTMLDAFILGIMTNSSIEVEKVYLTDVPIDDYCFENRQGAGEHEPQFAELLQKIDEADGLVIATPTYNFSVPARLKNLIDRMRPIALDMTRTTRLGQPIGLLSRLQVYFLVSGGTPTWAQKILFFAFPPFWLRAVFLYYNARVRGAIYTGNTKAFNDVALLRRIEKRGLVYAKHLCVQRSNNILERIFWRPPQRDGVE